MSDLVTDWVDSDDVLLELEPDIELDLELELDVESDLELDIVDALAILKTSLNTVGDGIDWSGVHDDIHFGKQYDEYEIVDKEDYIADTSEQVRAFIHTHQRVNSNLKSDAQSSLVRVYNQAWKDYKISSLLKSDFGLYGNSAGGESSSVEVVCTHILKWCLNAKVEMTSHSILNNLLDGVYKFKMKIDNTPLVAKENVDALKHALTAWVDKVKSFQSHQNKNLLYLTHNSNSPLYLQNSGENKQPLLLESLDIETLVSDSFDAPDIDNVDSSDIDSVESRVLTVVTQNTQLINPDNLIRKINFSQLNLKGDYFICPSCEKEVPYTLNKLVYSYFPGSVFLTESDADGNVKKREYDSVGLYRNTNTCDCGAHFMMSDSWFDYLCHLVVHAYDKINLEAYNTQSHLSTLRGNSIGVMPYELNLSVLCEADASVYMKRVRKNMQKSTSSEDVDLVSESLDSTDFVEGEITTFPQNIICSAVLQYKRLVLELQNRESIITADQISDNVKDTVIKDNLTTLANHLCNTKNVNYTILFNNAIDSLLAFFDTNFANLFSPYATYVSDFCENLMETKTTDDSLFKLCFDYVENNKSLFSLLPITKVKSKKLQSQFLLSDELVDLISPIANGMIINHFIEEILLLCSKKDKHALPFHSILNSIKKNISNPSLKEMNGKLESSGLGSMSVPKFSNPINLSLMNKVFSKKDVYLLYEFCMKKKSMYPNYHQYLTTLARLPIDFDVFQPNARLKFYYGDIFSDEELCLVKNVELPIPYKPARLDGEIVTDYFNRLELSEYKVLESIAFIDIYSDVDFIRTFIFENIADHLLGKTTDARTLYLMHFSKLICELGCVESTINFMRLCASSCDFTMCKAQPLELFDVNRMIAEFIVLNFNYYDEYLVTRLEYVLPLYDYGDISSDQLLDTLMEFESLLMSELAALPEQLKDCLRKVDRYKTLV